MIVNELLNFAVFYFKRVTKVQLCDVLASFYHDDELVEAKRQLCEVAKNCGSTIEGWSKVVNKKGVPIHRQGEGAIKRAADADDIIVMLGMLDVNAVGLPVYASVDLNRMPPPMTTMPSSSTPASSPTALDDLMKSFEQVIKRLDAIEARQVAASLPPSLPAPATQSPPVVPTSALALSGLQEPAREVAEVQGASPWAGVAVSGNYPALVAASTRKPIRVGSKQSDRCQVKAVPRHLACFVGRLDPSTTEEELSAHLTAEGMKGVVCRKLVPKNGQVFRTSAFKVTCSLESRDLFHNEACWPCGVELRDWVYYNRNG